MNSKPPAPSCVRSRALGQVELVREHGDLAELALRAALEQRDPLQQLDLRVLAQHRPSTVSCMTQSGAMIVDAVRSPIGKKNGTLSHIRGDELVGSGRERARRAERASIPPRSRTCSGAASRRSTSRRGTSAATSRSPPAGPSPLRGRPSTGSAAPRCRRTSTPPPRSWSGQLDLVVSGGVEMMSRVPMGSNNGSMSPLVHERYDIVMQGISAEEIAKQWKLSREELDRISYESHQRAARAIDEGRFEKEVVPIELDVPDPDGVRRRPRRSRASASRSTRPCGARRRSRRWRRSSRRSSRTAS